MNNQQIAGALTRLRPGASWALLGDTLDALVWMDEVQARPSDAEISAAITTVEVPQSVTPKQARLALSAAGLLTQVNAMVRAAPEATQIAWDYGISVDRNDPMLLALISQLDPPMSSEQVDQLFIAASAIP